MLESDSFWALVGLILFFGIIVYFKVPGMVLGALDRRTERIRTELDEARRLREEAQTLLSDYQKKRREAEKEAEDIVDEARREAERIRSEAEAKAADMVARRTEAAETKISQAEAQAVAEVRARAADLAVSAAETVLKEKIRGDASARLTENSIAAVRQHLN